MRYSYCLIALMIVTCLIGSSICFTGCGKDSTKSHGQSSQTKPKVSSSDKVTRITASQAINSARQVIQGPEWQLLSLSNTGTVAGSVTSEQFHSPNEALMLSDGKAGQWVVGFYRDSPAPVSDGEQTGFSYPFQRVLVTAQRNTELPEIDLAVPKKMASLKMEFVTALDSARQLATRQVKTPYDVMSVASWVSSEGECSWFFKFYDVKKGQIVGKVRVSGDGRKLMKWT